MPRKASEAAGRRAARVLLKPRDPFDLIRLLARSQSDPRKAVAELVQNSLDASARTIDLDWFNERGRRGLRIWDDGRGVFPEMEREAALRHLAQTIGHSHKLRLTPAQRREQMVLGRYGIGLIGFWSAGEELEIKSRVGGGKVWVLRLREDQASGEVFSSRARLFDDAATFTEVTVLGIHEAAVGKIRPPRLQAYLANELRGQLLERDAVVRIRDRVARGRAKKRFEVRPRPYLGMPIEDLRELEVPGFEAARVELYLLGPDESRRGVVALACGGTVVLDDIAEIDGVDQLREPWCSGRLEGVIDFPELHVSPSTRRGFSHDEPVAALLEALVGLERALEGRLAEETRLRAAQRRESLAREIRRAFLPVARGLPEYDFFGAPEAALGRTGESGRAALRGSAANEPAAGAARGLDAADVAPDAPPADPLHREAEREEDETLEPERGDDANGEEPSDGQLFAAGPMVELLVRPRALRLPPRASRSLLARALDADGRPCAGEVELAWNLEGPGTLAPDGPRATYSAPDVDPQEAPPIRIRLRATQAGNAFERVVPVHLAELLQRSRGDGIPEPQPVSAPGEPWRSRWRDGRWEYNEAHRDYLAVREVEARRLRYLIHLLAKEVVLRNFGAPGAGETLERMVEVLTWLEAGVRGRV